MNAFGQASTRPALQTPPPPAEYDAFVKLAANENNYGPPESVMKAMNSAFKYSNRYGYPDGGIMQEIAKHHGVKQENILLAAGSGEVLDVVGTTFLAGGKKVLGVEPTFSSVYDHATSIKAVGDQAAARQGFPAGDSGVPEGRARSRRRDRAGLSVQSEQPDRHHRDQG